MRAPSYEKMSKKALIDRLIEAEKQLGSVGAEKRSAGHPAAGWCVKTKSGTEEHSVTAGGSIVPLAEVERSHILRAYEETAHNKLRTAKLLRIGLNTLRRKLASYGVI